MTDHTQKQFTVKLRCTVMKLVTCKGCTEDQARENPFNFAVDEIETDQMDWEVISVEPEN